MSNSTLSNKVKQAIINHDKGYNCAQSVCCAFQNEVDLDEETLFRITEGLGLGMGNMDGTCGAISAAAILAGLKNSTANLNTPNSKAKSYKQVKECMNAFKERNQSVVCRELKGVGNGQVLAPCNKCIIDAVQIIEEHLFTDSHQY